MTNIGVSVPEEDRKSRGYHSPTDDAEMTAFIDGWNAAREGGDDFDLALHFWNRRRAHIQGHSS